MPPVRQRKLEGGCERVSLDDARARYPDSFAESRLAGFGNGDARWSGAVTGRLINSLSKF